MSTSCKSWRYGRMDRRHWGCKEKVVVEEENGLRGCFLGWIDRAWRGNSFDHKAWRQNYLWPLPPQQKQTNDVAVPASCPSATPLLDGSIGGWGWGLEKCSQLIYIPQKSAINPNMKLMKSLGVVGRSVGVHAGIGLCECVNVCV